MSQFILFFPEIYFFVSLTIIFLFCIIYSLSTILKFPNITINSIYISLISLIYTFFLFLNNSTYYFDYSILYKTKSNILLSELFIFIGIIILVTSINYNSKYHINFFEYLIFILISLGTLIVFLNLINVIFIYILLELQNILISILISIKRLNRYSIEASIKYFILGSFSSLIFLYGFSLIYGSTGLLSLYEINFFLDYFENINNNIVFFSVNIAFIFIFTGLLFKIYSAPFHFWLSDIYEGSPTSVLIYISTIQLLFMVFFFLKFYYYLFFDFLKLKNFILSIVSFLTLIMGSIGALIQRKLKKLISYSAITMNGFFLFSLVNNNIFLLETSLLYLIIYIFTVLLFFSLILNLFINNETIIKIYDLFNIYKYNKYVSILISILFFSISGLPPFIGFISKLFWLKSFFIEYNLFIFSLIFVFLIVNFYYIRLIKNIYMNFDNFYNVLFYVNKFNYISCLFFFSNQLLLFYFIFNTRLLTNFIHIIILDFISNVL